MSGAILRRNSSKQGLQNLLRVTAQRSVEDAEEVERERRRRARESFRRGSSPPGGVSQDNGTPAEDGLYDGELKTSSSLEEDEGFSDWTQRLERRRQQRMEELGQGQERGKEAASREAEMPENTLSVTDTAATRLQRKAKEGEEDEVKTLTWKEGEKRRKGNEEDKEERGRGGVKQREQEEVRVEQMRVLKKKENQRPEVEVKERRQEVKVSHTSKVFVNQEAKHNTNGNVATEEVTSHLVKTKRTSSTSTGHVAPAAELGEAEERAMILETEQRLEKFRRCHQEKENQELELLRLRQAEAEQELEELKRRREERREAREGEERRRGAEEQLRQAKEEAERRRMKEDIERRRMEAAEKMKTLSASGEEGEGVFSPVSHTHKITERTESLNRSLKKSNSFKKTLPPILLSKMDDRLEQYTQAIESSQEAKAAKQALVDIPSTPEAVASKKNLFEAGEAWSQSPAKGTPCKDAEGLKVGVADLITQWVKRNPDDSGKQSPSRPSDVRPGDVMQKKNMWEIIGDSSPGRPGAKGTPSVKRYKFVVTGHGKYEKIPVDENGDEYTNADGKSDLCQVDY
ncbi:non-muscle caldesmon [Osmerus eperlanus]|uniref:non-muscle caldesmon n=1 Tax=Osmerus eperlanus TaxID=29151 RepID=UPI002E120F11